MQKQILSTCLAISLIANASFVSAASSSDTTELTDKQSQALLGGLLLLGLGTTIYGQTVTRAEEVKQSKAVETEAAAKQQAARTLNTKSGHTYLWSTGSSDTTPIIEYVESCNPAKQYSVTAKIVNGTAEVEDSAVTVKNEACGNKIYDSRHKAVSEQAGDPWNLKIRFVQAEAKEKAQEARRDAESRAAEARREQAKQQKMAAAEAKGCSGLYVGRAVQTKTGGLVGFFTWGSARNNYVITGIDQVSKSVTLKSTDDGTLQNTECREIQYQSLI